MFSVKFWKKKFSEIFSKFFDFGPFLARFWVPNAISGGVRIPPRAVLGDHLGVEKKNFFENFFWFQIHFYGFLSGFYGKITTTKASQPPGAPPWPAWT